MISPIFPNMTELLEALSQPTGEDRDLCMVVRHIVTTVQRRLCSSTCAICVTNPLTRHFVEPLIISSDQQDYSIALCEEQLTQAILERDILMISDLIHPPPLEPAILTTLQHLSEVRAVVALSLCIKHRQKSLGVLYLLYQGCQMFSAEDQEIFLILADQITALLQGAWSQQRYREVAYIGQEINHQLSDTDAIFKKLTSHIGNILDANYALMLAVFQRQSGTLNVYQAEEGQLIFESGHKLEGASKYVLETQKPLFIRERNQEALHLPFNIAIIQGTRLQQSLIYVPLMLRGEPIGVLSIQHPRPNAYTEDDQFILELLANHVALALHNARLFRNLRRIYETGQTLTRQFESVETLQAIIEGIKTTTKADLIILYAYNPQKHTFEGPARTTGMLLKPAFLEPNYPSRPDSVATMMLSQREAIFAKESVTLYSSLLEEEACALQRLRFYQREQISSTAAIPLRVEENVVGVLFANFRQPQRFDATQKLLIEGLANYAAIAIKNAQTFERLSERRIHELETLQKIDSTLNTTNPELKEILNTILHLAYEQVTADHAGILLYNEAKETFTFGASIGSRTASRMAQPFIKSEKTGIVRWAIDHQQIALVNNVLRDPPWCHIYMRVIEETLSELDVPLIDEGHVIGVLNFESAASEAFRPEDALFLETLAGQAILAIKKAQAYEREKHFAERFRLLYQAGQELGKITQQSQLSNAYDTIIRLAKELSQSPVVIRRFDEELQILVLARTSQHRHTPPSLTIDLAEGYNGKVARERRTIVIDDIGSRSLGDFPQKPLDPTIQSLLITPIIFENRYYGNLELTHEAVAHFHDKDQEFFEGLAQQLASTLNRLEITQESQESEQRAQAAEVMASIGQSTYEITHRLGNDLGLVEYYVSSTQQTLKRLDVRNASIADNLHLIKQAVIKVMNLSESIRTVVSNWDDNDHFIPLPPHVLLEDTLNAVHIPDRIAVCMEIATDVQPVLVIHTLIADALINLVTNAIQAMGNGGQLTLRARNVGRHIALEIHDTGNGIPIGLQEKIFELFFSTKHSSGFGLWSARRNALKNRGTLQVRSDPDQGTTFTLLLPKTEGRTA